MAPVKSRINFLKIGFAEVKTYLYFEKDKKLYI